MDLIEATLPYPPSVNHYWMTRVRRNWKTGKMHRTVCKTPRAAQYIRDVVLIMSEQRRCGKPAAKFLKLEVFVYPPDKRRRDLDNVGKSILDSLQAAGAYHDDFDVWQLHIERCEVVKGGEVRIRLSEICKNAV